MTKYNIALQSRRIGDDHLIVISGGDIPHIGAIAVAIPYNNTASLSYIDIPKHKDTLLAGPVALSAAKILKATVVVILGIHLNNAEKDQISEICNEVSSLVNEYCHSISDK